MGGRRPATLELQARGFHASVTPVNGWSELGDYSREWEIVAARSSPVLGLCWLRAWVETFAPRRLAVARIVGADGPIALGLIERVPPGRWRFAGGDVTSERGLAAAPEHRADAWAAFAALLRAHPRAWSALNAFNVSSGARALPHARLTRVDAPQMRLPTSFAAYLQGGTRKGLRRVLHRYERAGGEVHAVDHTNAEDAVRAFISLHARRAASQGERHPAVDRRLEQLLLRAGRLQPSLVRIHEARLGDGVIGITIRLDGSSDAYFYNGGIDVERRHTRLSPGIVLLLHSIEDAIASGATAFHFGPGAYRYKTELGGDDSYGHAAAARSSSAVGTAVRALDRVRATGEDPPAIV